MKNKLPKLYQLPELGKLPEMGKLPTIKPLPEIKLQITQKSVALSMPDNKKNRTIGTSLFAAAIFAGASAKSKKSAWQDIFGLAAIGCAGYGIYKAAE